MGWHEWAGDEGTIIGIDHYGASAPGEEIMKHFGFTAEHVTTAALRLLSGETTKRKRSLGEIRQSPLRRARKGTRKVSVGVVRLGRITLH